MHWEVKRTDCSEKLRSGRVVDQLGCTVQSSEGGRAVAVHGNGMLLGSWRFMVIGRTLLGSMNGLGWDCGSAQRNMHSFWMVAQGYRDGLGRDVARWGWAARAWPASCEWLRRGFGWQRSKAADDGLGTAAVAWWKKPSHHSPLRSVPGKCKSLCHHRQQVSERAFIKIQTWSVAKKACL